MVGASADPSRIGYPILNNIITGGFKGRVYPINPNETEILGLRTYCRISDIADDIDLALVAVRAETTIESVGEMAGRGVKGAIILSGGFKEAGEEGKKREAKLLQIARAGGLRLIGPNCQGVVNVSFNMNATLDSKVSFLKPGVICFLSQGGDSGHGILVKAKADDVGLAKYVGMGNMSDLDFIDFLRYLKDDETAKIIMMYIAGIQRGREFLQITREVSDSKPIVAFKSGKTELASRAELSHTGSLAGSYRIYEAAFKQAGIIERQHPLEMLDVAKALAMQPLPRGNGVAIVTMVGGPGVTAAETCALKGVALCRLSPSTRDELSRLIPPEGSTMNPVTLPGGDITADVQRGH